MLVERDHAIVGTAGHIDHGKTALVKALTGLDVDTLAEEKRRGITIELGFAFMDVPGYDKEFLFIDVPGHEKLIKTMVAGASNLDIALLVIAADEGIKPQTVEHFEIIRLLEIPTGVVALTKADLVDGDRLQAVISEARELLAGSPLADAPIIPVSSATGQGVPEIRAALVEAAKQVPTRRDSGVFRMPIDRAFTMQGFGTVIAGTILAGQAKIGDKLEILPDGLLTRVRGIQVHAKGREESHIGIRTAINLQDIRKDQLRRGQTAVAPGSVTPTTRLDGQLHLLSSYGEDLKNRTRVRFHVGADEVIGRLVLLDCERLAPGQSAAAQFVLESPTVALPKDRYVIRTFSSMKTIGGGTILDANPPAHKRLDAATVDRLGKLKGGLADVVEQAFAKSGAIALTAAEVAGGIGESEDDVTAAIQELLGEGRLVKVSEKGAYLTAAVFLDLGEKLTGIIRDYYSKNPYRVYMPRPDVVSRFSKLADKQVCGALVESLVEEGTLRKLGTKVGIADRAPQWKPREAELAENVERMFLKAGYATPTEEEVCEALHIPPATFVNIMIALTDEWKLVRLAERVSISTKYLKSARDFVTGYIKEHGSITAPELRDELNVTRKYSVALLEYFDSIGLTRRIGDKRVLRQS